MNVGTQLHLQPYSAPMAVAAPEEMARNENSSDLRSDLVTDRNDDTLEAWHQQAFGSSQVT